MPGGQVAAAEGACPDKFAGCLRLLDGYQFSTRVRPALGGGSPSGLPVREGDVVLPPVFGGIQFLSS